MSIGPTTHDLNTQHAQAANAGFHAIMVEDQHLSAAQLGNKYNPNGDGEHRATPLRRAEWRQQVAGENTVIGYWDLVEYQIEQYHSDARCLAAPDQSAEEPSPALIRLIKRNVRGNFRGHDSRDRSRDQGDCRFIEEVGGEGMSNLTGSAIGFPTFIGVIH
ncbi:hypothetical protein [Paraburkholderia aromaticivorans]|uniref:hypothetical protein n=1 Tax=Paraburkholderia aromaticivorans TaxID=2026199 RepID=UPI0038BD519C